MDLKNSSPSAEAEFHSLVQGEKHYVADVNIKERESFISMKEQNAREWNKAQFRRVVDDNNPRILYF
uniref:Uncharacterized protein n=1 Tax=Romanomermis culicivorax TaxID=13658 RepID=A0A915JNG0_ROMCU